MRKPDLRVFVPPASSSRLQQIVWRSDGLRRARLLLQVRGRNPGMDWDRPRAPLWLGLHLTRSATFVVALRRKPSLWKPSHGGHGKSTSPQRERYLVS